VTAVTFSTAIRRRVTASMIQPKPRPIAMVATMVDVVPPNTPPIA
jgi:hypothetical protein